MATVKVCDFCKSEGKLVMAVTYSNLPGKRMKIDVCDEHKNSVPKTGIEFARLVLKFEGFPEISDENIKMILSSR